MQTLQALLKSQTLESPAVLKQLAIAHRHLGELKGKCLSIPNQGILLNSLALQEAQDSSIIENIITTQDELFKHQLSPKYQSAATKEVANYEQALFYLFEKLEERQLLTVNMMIEAQKILIANDAGIRTQLGTVIKNEQTGETVYTPPPPSELNTLMTDLANFINDDAHTGDLDPILKMALIHHQFESIHPFYDGNGRIGRIINIIYLVKENLLEIPVLYLSRYINHNKAQYYQLLQTVRDTSDWQAWLLFMIKGVSKTAQSTNQTISAITDLQQTYKHKIRAEHPTIYSQDLINNLFKHPYTKIQFVQDDLKISRPTASRYLEQLTKNKLLSKHKLGNKNFYINEPLVQILTQNQSLVNE